MVVIDFPYFSVYRDKGEEGKKEGQKQERKKRRKVDKMNGLRKKN